MSCFRFVTGIAPLAITRSGYASLFRSTHESPQPTVLRSPSAVLKTDSRVQERGAVPGGRRACLEGRVRLAARVRDEQVGAAVAVVVAGRDAHAGVAGSSTPSALRLVDEAEAEPGRIRLRAARDRLVDVQLVRILVVRDVEVGAAVAVHVGEDGAEAVVVRRRVEPGLRADLAEVRVAVRAVALVQEEQVAHAAVVRREAGDRARDRLVHVRVAGDEEVGPAVAVHVGDRGAGVPAVRDDARRRARPA